MAEFWWGISPNSAIRKHENFYPACQGRCKPILTHMLQGIQMDPNLLLKNLSEKQDLEIVYEDAVLIVVNKPAEFLYLFLEKILPTLCILESKRNIHRLQAH